MSKYIIKNDEVRKHFHEEYAEFVEELKAEGDTDIPSFEQYKNDIKKEDIKFLKELQQELKNQETDCQASPRYWTIGDYRMIPCPEGYEEEYYVGATNRDYYGSLDDLLNQIKEEGFEDLSNRAIEGFKEIACEVSAEEWLKEYYDSDAYLIPVKEEHFVHPNTMFLTKAEAKKHLELNNYHYSPKAHTYAMTAWRAPKVERLFKILESFDWDSI